MLAHIQRQHVLLGISIVILVVTVGFSTIFFRTKPPAQRNDTFTKEYGLQFTDYAGHTVHLFDFRRKVLIAYAWATWCPYCGAELENLGKLKATYGDSIQVVAINRGETLADAHAFTDRLSGVESLVFLLDPADSFFKQIAGFAMPETVFIDADGTVLYHQRGPIQMPAVDAKIKELLSK